MTGDILFLIELGAGLHGLTAEMVRLNFGDATGGLRVAVRHEAVRAEVSAVLGHE